MKSKPPKAGFGLWWFPGTIALCIIVCVTLVPIAALLLASDNLSLNTVLNNHYFLRVIQFSFYQAILSTGLSLLIAVPVATALAREHQFKGRSLLISLFSLSLVIPTIVAIFGIVTVYGRTGWLNQLTGYAGFEPFSLYGLTGILLAHVFFNMPLASRIFLQSLEQIPDEQWRLSAQLRMSEWSQFKWIEWPAIRSQTLGVALLIFSLCFTSFTIVLTLGGGPRATTIEVAIYQALRFDFDINGAVTLALVQLTLCGLIMLLSVRFQYHEPVGFNYSTKHYFRRPSKHRWLNVLLIGVAMLFVVLPLLGILIAAINPAMINVVTHAKTLVAVFNTLWVSISAATISLLLGIGLLLSTRHLRVRLNKQRLGIWVQLSGNIILVLPPVVLGTGLFLLLRPFADVFALALFLTVLINSMMALPFVLRILDAPVIRAAANQDRLAQSLGISGLNRWRLLDFPVLKKPIGLAMGIAAALSAGDFSAIALFGSERAVTLPLLLYQRMGSYRLHEAAATALLLLLMCLILFVVLQYSISAIKTNQAVRVKKGNA